jgi:DNA-binding transcriptional ArsR family regulator
MKKKAETQNCAKYLKVLGDQTRLEVIRELSKGTRNVTEIIESVRIPQSLLSHHLSVLRKAGLVTAKRVGKAVLYKISNSIVCQEDRQTVDLGCCEVNFPNKI